MTPRKPATAEQRALLARLAVVEQERTTLASALSDIITMVDGYDLADGYTCWTREERAGLDRMGGELRRVRESVQARLDAARATDKEVNAALDATGWDGPP